MFSVTYSEAGAHRGAEFNLAYAAGLMLGPTLAGAGTGVAGFGAALAALAALVAVLGSVGVARLPCGL